MAKSPTNPKKTLERLRSHEMAGALALSLGAREAEVAQARELVRHIGEHQAAAAGRLPDMLAQAIVEAAVQIEHTGFLKALAETGAKGAVSAAKRGLSILRSKGIEVEVAAQGEPVFRAEAAKNDELPCLLSTPDGAGERILFVPKAMRGGGLQVITALISDQQGFIRISVDEVSRKSFRGLQERSRGRSERGSSLSEVPLSHAKDLLAWARSLSRGLEVEEQAALASYMGDPAAAAPAASREAPLSGALEAQRLEESARLFDEPEIDLWVPSEEAARALDLKLEEIATSSLYVSQEQKDRQTEHEVDRAADTYFAPGPQRALWALRLFQVADAFRSSARLEAAESAAATARALQSGAPVAAIAFCRRLFGRMITGGAPVPDPAEVAGTPTPDGLVTRV